MKVVVTGGNGRAGQWVVRDLAEAGHDVVNLDVTVRADLELPGEFCRIDLTDAGQVYDALAQFRPYFAGAPVYDHSISLEQWAERSPLSVGSPQQVIDKTLEFREIFGDYQRQLWIMDHSGLPVEAVLDQIELLGSEVVPVLRKEMAARRAPGAADAPTHDGLVRAKYGDEAPRQVRPNANRGDNVTGTSPYQDSPSRDSIAPTAGAGVLR